MQVLRITFESFRFAWNALKSNLLRTTLSLLGVTIGIFAIIAVFTIVDSLENSIKSSLNFLGSNNINVEKWPYGLGDGPYPWWKYMKRPQATYEEYEFLANNAKKHLAITIAAYRDNVVVKQKNNSTRGTMIGAAFAHKDVYEIPIERGRYFTQLETSSARNVAILGSRVAKDLFPFSDPLGKQISIRGLKYYVVGTIKEEGEAFIGGMPTNDDNIYIPYKSMMKIFYSGAREGLESSITVKGDPADIGLIELENELKGLMRIKRGLKPAQEDNFALNRPEAIVNFIGSAFDVLGVAGWVIGSFSILVGGFGIANIMFVSVKERTNIIGIQKSLGAKNYFILFQFLFEAIFLSVIGGGTGILFVYLLSFASLGSLELQLTVGNIVLGLGVSAVIGMVSGIIPAATASRLDPVIAIRSQ